MLKEENGWITDMILVVTSAVRGRQTNTFVPRSPMIWEKNRVQCFLLLLKKVFPRAQRTCHIERTDESFASMPSGHSTTMKEYSPTRKHSISYQLWSVIGLALERTLTSVLTKAGVPDQVREYSKSVKIFPFSIDTKRLILSNVDLGMT